MPPEWRQWNSVSPPALIASASAGSGSFPQRRKQKSAKGTVCRTKPLVLSSFSGQASVQAPRRQFASPLDGCPQGKLLHDRECLVIAISQGFSGGRAG